MTEPKEFWRQRFNKADDKNMFNNYGLRKPMTRHRSIVELSQKVVPAKQTGKKRITIEYNDNAIEP